MRCKYCRNRVGDLGGNGMCHIHYGNYKKYGDPLLPKRMRERRKDERRDRYRLIRKWQRDYEEIRVKMALLMKKIYARKQRLFPTFEHSHQDQVIMDEPINRYYFQLDCLVIHMREVNRELDVLEQEQTMVASL